MSMPLRDVTNTIRPDVHGDAGTSTGGSEQQRPASTVPAGRRPAPPSQQASVVPSSSGRTPAQHEHNAAQARLRRQRAAADRDDDKENKIREALHDASGSTITANSRRLRTLPEGPERDVAKRDVEDDIARYVEVPIETKAKCVTDYGARERRAINLHCVCGGCGVHRVVRKARLPPVSCRRPAGLSTR